MNAEELASLVVRLERAGVSELAYRDGAEALTLRFAGVAEPPTEVAGKMTKSEVLPETPSTKHKEIFANATGAFSRTHPLAYDSPPAAIRQGDHVGYLTVESVLSAITAPADGRAGSQLVDDGKTVGFGQAVLELHDA